MTDDQYTIGGVKFTRADIENSLYLGYTEADLTTLAAFPDAGLQPEPGFIVDVYGIRTRTSSLWSSARTMDGLKYGLPIPCNFCAEAIEWLGLVKSVLNAKDRYTAMELGAGMGPWIVAGAVLARRRGISDIRLTGVEGDETHFAYMLTHFRDNGLDPKQHCLYSAAVGATPGVAHWPAVVAEESREQWGYRPIPAGEGDYMGRSWNEMREVQVLGINDLLREEPTWDLVHIDIQGGETEVCRVGAKEFDSRVRRVVIGTHSRKHEGDLMEMFASRGWVLEHEKPARFTFWPGHTSLEQMTTADGTQVWSNPSLA